MNIPLLHRSRPARLIDAPLVNNDRKALVEQMAAELIEANAFHDERAAIRYLDFKGYGTMKVFMCVADACYLAQQEMVAREMSGP